MALKRSPIDAAMASRARQAHGGRAMPTAAEGGTSSTILFHHSTSHGAADVGTESAAEGIQIGALGAGTPSTHEQWEDEGCRESRLGCP